MVHVSNSNGSRASVISAAIVVALFSIMLTLFLGVSSRCATNASHVARLDERTMGLREDVSEIKSDVKAIRAMQEIRQ